MAKGGRKRKEKKKDFQKVKLKVGKRKLPANNETETSFKSQAIFIPTQLKSQNDTNDEPLTQRKQSIVDLLIQSGHFNANTRVDSLSGLKVLISNNKHLAALHIAKIVEKLPKLLVDVEAPVRKACLQVFKVVFSNLKENQISPFFDIISKYLQCAMCHLHETVQQDALHMFDFCLEYFPRLLCGKNKKVILNQFLELISTKQGPSATKNVNNKGGRILSMKLSGKESSVNWRIKVLSRLNKLLNAIAEIEDAKDNSVLNGEVEMRWDSHDIVKSLQLASRKIQPDIAGSSFSIRLDPLSSLTTLQQSENTGDGHDKEVTNTIIQLMLECCVEVEGKSSAYSREAISTLYHALNIIGCLVHKMFLSSEDKIETIEEIRHLYLKDFFRHYFQPFPIHFSGRFEQSKAKKQKTEEYNDVGQEVLSINLSIASLLSLVILKDQIKDENPQILKSLSSVALYLGNILDPNHKLSQRTELNVESLNRILTTYPALLNLSGNQETQDNILMPLLLYCDNLPPMELKKYEVLKFLSKLYDERLPDDLESNESVLEQWVSSLPGILLSLLQEAEKSKPDDTRCLFDKRSSVNNTFQVILHIMRLAACKNNELYLTNLQEIFAEILRYLIDYSDSLFCAPTCSKAQEVKYCPNCSKLQHLLIESTVIQLPNLSSNEAKLLSHWHIMSVVNPLATSYCSELMLSRIKPSLYSSSAKQTEDASVFMYLCTVIMGTTKNKLAEVQTNFVNKKFLHLSVLRVKRQMEICEIITKYFEHILFNSPGFYRFLDEFIDRSLLNTFLPTESFLGQMAILKILQRYKCLFYCYINNHEQRDVLEVFQQVALDILSPDVIDPFVESFNEIDYSNDDSAKAVASILTDLMSLNMFKETSLITKWILALVNKMQTYPDISDKQWLCDLKYKVESSI